MEGPDAIDDGASAAFIVGDLQKGLYDGLEYPIENLRACEVRCRDELAQAVLGGVHKGDDIIVYGTLDISVPLDSYRDQDLVLVSLRAETIGHDICSDTTTLS